MPLCSNCKIAGDEARDRFNSGVVLQVSHPTDCGCPCQHLPPVEWGQFFDTEEIQFEDVV